MQQLSRNDPDRWDPGKIGTYATAYHSGLWKSPKANPDMVAQSRQRVLDYLIINPDASRTKLQKDGLLYDLSIGFCNSLNAAKRELHLEERPPPAGTLESRHKQSLRRYLRNHPHTTASDIKTAGYTRFLAVYGGIDNARLDAGIVPAGYVSAAQAGRDLHVTTERVSQLVDANTLDGFRVGRRLYVSSDSVSRRQKL